MFHRLVGLHSTGKRYCEVADFNTRIHTVSNLLRKTDAWICLIWSLPVTSLMESGVRIHAFYLSEVCSNSYHFKRLIGPHITQSDTEPRDIIRYLDPDNLALITCLFPLNTFFVCFKHIINLQNTILLLIKQFYSTVQGVFRYVHMYFGLISTVCLFLYRNNIERKRFHFRDDWFYFRGNNGRNYEVTCSPMANIITHL